MADKGNHSAELVHVTPVSPALEASPASWKHPPSFYCPISQQCMHDPVVLSDGHTYERRHIERWLQRHNTSPVSGLELRQKDFFPNHALRNAIEEYFQQIFSAHRRAIRKSINGAQAQVGLGSNGRLLRTIDALMQCSLLVNADLSVEVVLRQIMDEAKTLVGAEVASVFLVDARRQDMYSTVNSTGGEIRIPIQCGIAGHVVTSGEPLIIDDAYADSRFDKSVDKRTGFVTRNIMCVPLKVKKEHVIGVVNLINKSGPGLLADDTSEDRFGVSSSVQKGFTPDDLQFLQVFACQAATAIANSAAFREREVSVSPASEPGSVSSLEAVVVAADEKRGATDEKSEVPRIAPKRASEAQDAMSPKSPGDRRRNRARLQLAHARTSFDQELAACSAEREILEKGFASWNFDGLKLAEATGNKPLSTLCIFLFHRLGLVDHFDLDQEKLRYYFLELEQGYDDHVCYHNRAHAASVVHATHMLLQTGNLPRLAAAAYHQDATDRDGWLEMMALLLAAAMHDYEHLGLNNDFLVRTTDERAVRYNNLHVNEQHHLSEAWGLLLTPEYNFLGNLPQGKFRHFRKLIIDLIIATDMGWNSDILKSFNDAIDNAMGKPDAPEAFHPATPNEATLLLQMAIKCADLGHLTLPWEQHMRWVHRLEQEFFEQGDKEKAVGLAPISFLMDRDQPGVSKKQVGFFDYVALPLFRALARAIPAAANTPLEGVTANYRRWYEIEIGPLPAEKDRELRERS